MNSILGIMCTCYMEILSYNLKEGNNIDAHVLNVKNMAHILNDLG
jgi:hypothetical protein